MAGLNITSEQFRSVMQNLQTRYVKLELLNQDFQTVDNLEGVVTSGSINIDANADIRRTANLTMVVDNSSFEVKSGNRIWLERYVKIWVGIYSLTAQETQWTNCGIYIIDAPSYSFDAATNTLSVTLLDLMAKLTGERNGYLPALPVILSAGENIRGAIIDTLALGGFKKYIVEEAPSPGVIPNDLEFNQGSTIFDLLQGLRDIYPNYEMFFDVNGTFFYKEIPSGNNDPIMVDDTLWDNIVSNETIDVDFQNVKNSIEVYGRTHDPAYFSPNTSVSGSTISLNIAGLDKLNEGDMYGFTLKDNPGYRNMNIRINSFGTMPLRMSDGVTSARIEAEGGEVYFCILNRGNYMEFLGHVQAYGFAEDTNRNSPFYVNGPVGRIRLPLVGGEYANCYSDELAQERAEYELYLHTNMNNSVTLTCVPVPWLDVNIKVSYTPKRAKEPEQYMIKSISFGLSPQESMSINMVKFYPFVPEN